MYCTVLTPLNTYITQVYNAGDQGYSFIVMIPENEEKKYRCSVHFTNEEANPHKKVCISNTF